MPLFFQGEILPVGFSLLTPSRRAAVLAKTPRSLITGVVASPTGFCFAAIDPEDLNAFYIFSYRENNGSTKKHRHIFKSAVNLIDGRRMIKPTMRKVKNGSIVWGESGVVDSTTTFARAVVQLLAQNLDLVSDSNPVLRRLLEGLSCSQACLVGARDAGGIPLAQVIRNAEILRDLPPIMHIGPACAGGGSALDFPDGRYYNLEKSYCDHKNFDLQTDALRREGCEDPNEYKEVFVEYLACGEEVFNSLFTPVYMAKYNPDETASSKTSASISTSSSGAPTTTTPGSQLSMADFFKSTPSPRSTPSSTMASASTSASASASASASVSASTSASASASASVSEAKRNKRKQSMAAFSRLGESLKKNKGKGPAEPYDSADEFSM
jgi:hypothetical protein